MPWFAFAEARARGALQGRRGVTSIEFAVVASLSSTLLLGSAECAKYFMTAESVRAASAEAVRIVMLRGGSNINNAVTPCQGMTGSIPGLTARVRFLDPNRLTANMFGCVTNNGTSRVSVSLTYQYTFTIPIFGAYTSVITESTQAVFY